MSKVGPGMQKQIEQHRKEFKEAILGTNKNENTMKPCVGAKIVKAKPFSFHEYKETYLNQVDHGDEQDLDGYLVEYPDGYKGWNAKGAFEYASRELTPAEYSMLSLSTEPEVDNGRAKYYVTTKILGLDFKSGIQKSDGSIEEEGYKVEYPNGHQSWTPKIKADEVYREINQDEYNLISDILSESSGNDINIPNSESQK